MDEEIRSLRRALERRGLRFVALVHVRTRSAEKGPSWVKVTMASRCGADDYKNLMRSHYWAVPVWTLEDLADLQIRTRVDFVYDLERRRVLGGKDEEVTDWPATELEDGWGDTAFAMNCSVTDLRRRFGAPAQVAGKLASGETDEA